MYSLKDSLNDLRSTQFTNKWMRKHKILTFFHHASMKIISIISEERERGKKGEYGGYLT